MLTPQQVRDALPAAHRKILDGLLDYAGEDPRIRFVELCCSAARGAADELSDLDLGLGISEEAWPEPTAEILPRLHRLGEVVAALEHRIPEWGDAPHLRVFVQYASGPQVDLVAFPASRRTGLPAGSVALYDADGRLARPMEIPIRTATARDVVEWTFLGWVALIDLDKYVRRGSAWEALARLQEARDYVWRLLAVARGLDYPAFGLTSVLDAPGDLELPPAMADTVATLDLGRITQAALALADVLDDAAQSASAAMGTSPGDGRLAGYARQRLTGGASA